MSDDGSMKIRAHPRRKVEDPGPAPAFPIGEPVELTLWTSEYMSEGTRVSPLGEDLYRLEWTPISEEDARLGSIVRLRYVGEGEYEIAEILEQTYETETAMIPRTFADPMRCTISEHGSKRAAGAGSASCRGPSTCTCRSGSGSSGWTN